MCISCWITTPIIYFVSGFTYMYVMHTCYSILYSLYYNIEAICYSVIMGLK